MEKKYEGYEEYIRYIRQFCRDYSIENQDYVLESDVVIIGKTTGMLLVEVDTNVGTILVLLDSYGWSQLVTKENHPFGG